MKHRIPHDLDHELARAATRRALEAYKQDLAAYRPEREWLSPDAASVRFTVLGKTLAGRVDVLSDAIQLDLDVPFLWRAFQSTAVQIIDREIRTWIQRAKDGTLDG